LTDETAAYHIPVLADVAVSLLVTDPVGIYVDGTLGGGGHSARLLRHLSAGARLIAFDQDAEAILHARQRLHHDKRVTFVHDNTTRLRPLLHQLKLNTVNGILLDIGMSSRHLNAAERGFSHRLDGPLDMRMDVRSDRTAADILAESSREELERIIREYGEERRSARIADAVIKRRAEKAFTRTRELAELIEACAPGPHPGKSTARVFQALRIAVNGELDALDEMLPAAAESLSAGGRMAVISYHSLEDRRVKEFLRREASRCNCPSQLPICVCGVVPRMRILTPKPIRPDENEILSNPRARSARLRAGEKLPC